MRYPRPGATRERGIAIVTALLVVALVAALAASVVWRELVAVRDVSNQRLNTEMMWVERAAVEWARAALREQAATSNVAFYGQQWSSPVRDVQLADFLPREAIAVNGDLADAYISGQVEDAQAKFNVMDLVSRPGPSQPYQVDGSGVLAYRRLLSDLSLSPALAQTTADYILLSRGIGGGESWPLQLVSVEDLVRVPGYDKDTVRILSNFVTVLPDYTLVNANTAPAPALVAAIPALSDEQAQMLTQRRSTAYFNSAMDIALVLAPVLTAGSTSATTTTGLPSGALAGVNSGYFIVHCRIHSARINTRIDTLIARYGIGDFSWTSVIWVHRLAS
ncbi:type II secretion system minor pseudopilin GspK [Paraburkholderia sp. BCC1885]|uniref:type II secretion system minor pseudopilin GspK n=1 Tax=Paraburkholderia sp. BCC1885 TaxID=2562669 RepID=UPI0011835334|nr:type II secretion system minor pseudopilin GspK [Paraburkholderia sp. BCC1885]